MNTHRQWSHVNVHNGIMESLEGSFAKVAPKVIGALTTVMSLPNGGSPGWPSKTRGLENPPNPWNFNKVFHDFHHPFWGGLPPLFLETPIWDVHVYGKVCQVKDAFHVCMG